MSGAGGKRRAARRWYLAHTSDALLRNEEQRRATRTGAGDPSPKPVPATPSATDVDLSVLRIVRWYEPDEVERRRAEATEAMLRTLGSTSPYV